MSDPYDYADELDDGFEDDEDDFGFDCGLGEDGQCSMAGSEDCDWECPNSRGPYFVGSRAWNKRHDSGFPLAGCRCSACAEARRNPQS